MHFATLLALSLPVLGAVAAPRPRPSESCVESSWSYTQHHKTTTTTTTTTTSKPTTTTTTTTTSSTTTSAAPITYPTAPYTVISARSGSPIHLLELNAAGQNFYLGGAPATFCPAQVADCPPGDVTAFLGLGALDTEVPGGQIVYVAPDGHLGFTQAHSATSPAGAVLSPFTYTKDIGAQFGDLGTNAFGATGFMACPNTSGSSYQVFAAIATAQVPTGNVSDCLGFDALTSDFISDIAAAWEYT